MKQSITEAHKQLCERHRTISVCTLLLETSHRKCTIALMEIEQLRGRLATLNTKAYYLLVALSFVYLSRTKPTFSLKLALTLTAIVAALPVQDYNYFSPRWLAAMRWTKVGCLTAATLFALWWVWVVSAS